jgi:hypothetical protein
MELPPNCEFKFNECEPQKFVTNPQVAQRLKYIPISLKGGLNKTKAFNILSFSVQPFNSLYPSKGTLTPTFYCAVYHVTNLPTPLTSDILL